MDINIYIYKDALLIENTTDEIELIARRVFTNSKIERTGDDMWVSDNMTFIALHDFIDNITYNHGDDRFVRIM